MRLALLLFVAALLVAQGPKPIPRHKPDGNPQHDNQPEFCINSSHMGYQQNCTCKGMADAKCEGLPGEPEEKGGGESPKCAVYCRKTMCRCASPCES